MSSSPVIARTRLSQRCSLRPSSRQPTAERGDRNGRAATVFSRSELALASMENETMPGLRRRFRSSSAATVIGAGAETPASMAKATLRIGHVCVRRRVPQLAQQGVRASVGVGVRTGIWSLLCHVPAPWAARPVDLPPASACSSAPPTPLHAPTREEPETAHGAHRLLRRYLGAVARRSRILSFGLVLVGVLCAALVGGLTGEVLAIALVSIGLGGAVLLVFLEVGLSEDRQRAHDAERRRPQPPKRPVDPPRRPPIHRLSRRLG
jgi:hypothetical protein